MAAMFESLIVRCVENGELELSAKQIELISHNIIVEGQMWAFRRWALQKLYTLDEYIELQTEQLFHGIHSSTQARS